MDSKNQRHLYEIVYISAKYSVLGTVFKFEIRRLILSVNVSVQFARGATRTFIFAGYGTIRTLK